MTMMTRLALTLGLALAPVPLHAQDAWPSRPITFVVPYAAGGYTDLVGRLTARYVEKALGKPVVVESRPGAGGIVGTQVVANAAPDGYTFCVCSVGAVSIALFAQKIGYDPLRDLAPGAPWQAKHRGHTGRAGQLGEIHAGAFHDILHGRDEGADPGNAPLLC